MFACSQGGHFSQMMALEELFGKYPSVLVTDNIRATKEIPALTEIKQIEYAMSIAKSRNGSLIRQRSRINHFMAYFRLVIECRKIWKKYKPAVIISTGSNIAVPLFWIGKLHGSKTIFIETRAKVYARSLTGILVRYVSDIIFVQWPEMLKLYPEAKYCGTLV